MLTALRRLCWMGLLLVPGLGWWGETAQSPDASRKATVQLIEVTREAGLTFLHQSAAEKKYIVESMGGGVAMFDFDRDGWLDLYLLNSSTVEGALAGKARPKAALYRNLGNGTFREVADAAGLADPGWSMGVAVADYDNDGWDDLYVTCFGPNRLFRNRGNGTFEEVTKRAGVGDDRFSTGAAWGDYDRDGDLDLLVNELDGSPMLLRNEGGEPGGELAQSQAGGDEIEPQRNWSARHAPRGIAPLCRRGPGGRKLPLPFGQAAPLRTWVSHARRRDRDPMAEWDGRDAAPTGRQPVPHLAGARGREPDEALITGMGSGESLGGRLRAGQL